MRIVFEMGHPADVHLFRNAISELRDRGHSVAVAAIAKETLTELLGAYRIDYALIGKNTPTLAGKALTLPIKDISLIKWAGAMNPDIIVSMSSPYAAHASAVLGIPHIAFNDTEISTAIIRVMLPFTDAVCTPGCFTLDLGPKQVRFDGYKELAYLHPCRFTPDPATLSRIGAKPGEKLIIVRFGVIDSSHDVGHHGLGLENARAKLEFIHALEEHGRVFVTSESQLGPDLSAYLPRLPIPELHDLLYFASLYIGDGATMASEAGVLGTPWIYVSDSTRGYLEEQQHRYGLGFREESAARALARATALLQTPGVKAEWQLRRAKMISEKVDVTTFMVNIIERWPFAKPGLRSRHGA